MRGKIVKKSQFTVDDLLDELAEKMKCQFVSDIHSESYKMKLHEKLAELTMKNYTVEVWQKVSIYILNEETEKFQTQEEAVAYLKKAILE